MELPSYFSIKMSHAKVSVRNLKRVGYNTTMCCWRLTF